MEKRTDEIREKLCLSSYERHEQLELLVSLARQLHKQELQRDASGKLSTQRWAPDALSLSASSDFVSSYWNTEGALHITAI
jgi:hypothetical protein